MARKPGSASTSPLATKGSPATSSVTFVPSTLQLTLKGVAKKRRAIRLYNL